jgi:hypothetical protein
MLLRCPVTEKCQEEFVCSKWLNINEGIPYRKIISCTNAMKMKTTGKYLNLNVNGRSKLGRGTTPPELSWENDLRGEIVMVQ